MNSSDFEDINKNNFNKIKVVSMSELFERSSARHDVLQMLRALQTEVGEQYLPSNFEVELSGIHSPEDVLAVVRNPKSALWWFIGPVAYALFGKDGHILDGRNLRHTIAILPPPFVADAVKATEEISSLGCSVSMRHVQFSRLFASLLYGAYPWFDAYMKACCALSVFDKDAVVLDIELPPNLSPIMFNEHKERIRTLLSPQIEITIDGSKFPGLIRPIHTPEPIEITRHAKVSRL